MSDILVRSAVIVGASAEDRKAAIDLVGWMLVGEGRVEPGYVKEMHDREAMVSTYLGNGIALPHGTNEARSAVIRTGLAVAQFPAGVPWGDERAYLVVALAATSEDHIGILSRLATILDDDELCRRLASTPDAGEIYAALVAPEEDDGSNPGPKPQSGEIALALTITNPSGLHARPAAAVVDRLRTFHAEIAIETRGRRANARSITALLGLGAATGDDVRIVARGTDAQAAIDAIAEIVSNTSGG